MRNMIQSARVTLVCASLIFGAPAMAKAGCCKRVVTDFGAVFVADRDVSLATEFGKHVSQKAKDVLRLADVRFVIVDAGHSKYQWGDTTTEGLAVYPWRFVHGTNYVALQPPNAILPHEMAHDLLNRHLIPNTRPGQYGSDAPDWVDEAVAIAFELSEDKAQRRCEVLSLVEIKGLIRLSRFLTMEHPDLGSIRKAGSARNINFASTASEDTPAFYAMSIALPEYLAAKTRTPSVLADVIEAVLKGVPLNDWLLSRLAAPGQTSDMDAIERDFLAWLGSPEGYVCIR